MILVEKSVDEVETLGRSMDTIKTIVDQPGSYFDDHMVISKDVYQKRVIINIIFNDAMNDKLSVHNFEEVLMNKGFYH